MDEEQDPLPTLDEVVWEIVRIHEGIANDWKNLTGWAPENAAALLDASRLDWLASLARALRLWTTTKPTREEHDGKLILAWANLGSLLEGTMKFFLCVHASDYEAAVSDGKDESVFKRLWDKEKAEAKQPDGLMLEVLRQFYEREVWMPSQRDKWSDFVAHVQSRRNTIHAYQDRDLGDFDEFEENVRRYADFLNYITSSLPPLPDPSDYYS